MKVLKNLMNMKVSARGGIESIEKLIDEMKLEVKGDTIVLPEIDKANKKKERELNKLFRIKKRLNKEFSENALIEIKIFTD